MAVQTIQVGIDLGTTNSEVSVNHKGSVEVVKNILQDEYTPSVFGFDKAKNKLVGKKAYTKLFTEASVEDVSNFKAEVKRLMGTSEKVSFPRVDLQLNAEEISAEILKSLREDVLRKYPDVNASAAVITVPAYFTILQSEATKRAGNLAGFQHVVLIQEPIAAAISYGFNNHANENWLVYDLGGGTFDVALIASADGSLSVLSHNGDNFLGGKDIDQQIVNQLLLPELVTRFKLSGLSKNNKTIFSKLKNKAEEAKIALSQEGNTTVVLEDFGNDEEGKEIFTQIIITREQLEKILKPFVDKTIELSKKTIKDAGIRNTTIKKIILVGGPTQIPYIRERLEAELKIKTDSSVDPLTVVSRGAAIYALGQKIPKELIENTEKKQKKGALSINLNYDPLTSESEQIVSGVVEGAQDDEYWIQIQSDSGTYSNKTKLKSGKFIDTVSLEEHKQNIFWVYIFDEKGNSIPVRPDSFTITHGLSVQGAPIAHSLGIALVNKGQSRGKIAVQINEFIFEKGAILPLKKDNLEYKTALKLVKGNQENPLWILISEGESENPDNNIYVCELGINGKDLPYDLPEGTELRMAVELDESRTLSGTVYIPMIDRTIQLQRTTLDQNVTTEQLREELNVQKDRITKVAPVCSPEEQKKLDSKVEEISTEISNATTDEDEKRKANKSIKELKTSLESIESTKEMPQLISEYHENFKGAEAILEALEDESEKTKLNARLAVIRSEAEKAINQEDKQLLVRINEQLGELSRSAFFSKPSGWIYLFQLITNGEHHFKDEQAAKYYTEKGQKAIADGNVEELKRCIGNLQELLPEDEKETGGKKISGITH